LSGIKKGGNAKSPFTDKLEEVKKLTVNALISLGFDKNSATSAANSAGITKGDTIQEALPKALKVLRPRGVK
jgi:Holliday junction resolvasome RuvABC DNA-binding subunit